MRRVRVKRDSDSIMQDLSPAHPNLFAFREIRPSIRYITKPSTVKLFPVNGRGFVHSHNFGLARHPADSRLKANQGWKDVTETVNKTKNKRKTRKT